MCARRVLKWSSKYLTLYVGAQARCACARPLRVTLFRTSSAFAVAGKELVEQLLKCGVLGHDVVLAQVVAAGRAGVHLCSERPLKASLRRDGGEGEGEGKRGRG